MNLIRSTEASIPEQTELGAIKPMQAKWPVKQANIYKNYIYIYL